jgi:alpha-N-arabinofuranosidase
MKWVDPSIELVACGSSNSRMPTFGSWEATVLEHTYEHVDYVSMHTYYEERHGDRGSFLACATDMDHFIDGVVATIDYIRAKGRHRKPVHISFDEWNVWYLSHREELAEWEWAPRLIEDQYNVVDAVVVGNLLISLLRHADRVKIGCLAQLVNVIAPIRSEPGGPAWRQTIYHPFALTSRYGRGTALRVIVESPRYETSWFGDVPVLDAVAVHHEDTGEVTLFAVNRGQSEELSVEIDTRALSGPSTAVSSSVSPPARGTWSGCCRSFRVGQRPVSAAGSRRSATPAATPSSRRVSGCPRRSTGRR